jgi:hypothetical protein
MYDAHTSRICLGMGLGTSFSAFWDVQKARLVGEPNESGVAAEPGLIAPRYARYPAAVTTAFIVPCVGLEKARAVGIRPAAPER